MPLKPTPTLCVKCKSMKRLCGLDYCPRLLRLRSTLRTIDKIKNETIFGATPPSLIVGEFNYPLVNVLPAIPPEISGLNAKYFDNPEAWWGKLSIDNIIDLRAKLIHTKVKYRVDRVRELLEKDRLFEEIALAVMSVKPIDIEAKLRSKPTLKLSFDDIVKPVGPTAPLDKLRIVQNPMIPRKIDKVVNDDLKAVDAVIILYTNNISIYDIIRVFSIGLLGRRKRIVPTRWSITAVDKIVGDYLLKEVRRKPIINTIRVYNITYLDNHFEILLIPQSYSYELLEIWHPNTLWTPEAPTPIITSNYELHDGRLRGEMDGGYYAIRTGILEGLQKIGYQALVLVIREIGSGYYAPVGNWHLRESIRQAFSKRYESFQNIGEALNTISRRIKVPINTIIKRSRLMKRVLYQLTLKYFLNKLC